MASVLTPGQAPGLPERLRAWRDRRLMSASFQRWASRFWLTRPVARRRARALFDLCAGFVYSQVLHACVRLNLFEILAEGPQDPAALAPRLSLPQDAARRLLDAAAALDLAVRRRGGRYGLGPLGAALLGNPGVRAMVEHHALLYADLADPVALLRGGRDGTRLGRYWAYAGGRDPASLQPEEVAAYSALMTNSQGFIASEVLGAYPLPHHGTLLDVGGGEGVFVEAAAGRAPGLRLHLFDLPAVAGRARERLAAAGLADRIEVWGGDFLNDPLPTGADVVSLVRVLHDHDDAAALRLLRNVRRSLRPGAVLLIAEPMAGTRGAEPIGDAYFGFYLLAMGQGRARRLDEVGALLGDAGFSAPRLHATAMPMLTRVLTARALPESL